MALVERTRVNSYSRCKVDDRAYGDSQRSTPHRRQQGGERRAPGAEPVGFRPPRRTIKRAVETEGDAARKSADELRLDCRAEVPK